MIDINRGIRGDRSDDRNGYRGYVDGHDHGGNEGGGHEYSRNYVLRGILRGFRQGELRVFQNFLYPKDSQSIGEPKPTQTKPLRISSLETI